MTSQKKYKICRRVGGRVFPKCDNPKLVLTPKRKITGKTRARAMSEFGIQLIDKQKVRYIYNLRERQFANYVRKASLKKGVNPTEYLYRLLESRLDNIVFRLGLTKTRTAARQMVSHGHIMVNGKKVSIPSFGIRSGDMVSIRPQSQEKGLFQELGEKLKDHSPPSWLAFDEKKREGKVKSMPVQDNVSGELLNLTSVIEFYGR